MNRYSIGSIIGILVLWELLVRGLQIPRFLLPAPTTIVSYVYAKAELLALHTAMTLIEAGVPPPRPRALVTRSRGPEDASRPATSIRSS